MLNSQPLAALTQFQLLFMGAFLLCFALSCLYLFRATLPAIAGGRNSLVYFHEIAGLREADYLGQFIAQTVDEHVNDLLGQVWRNSQIAAQKFRFVEVAMRWLIGETVLWLACLVWIAYHHQALKFS